MTVLQLTNECGAVTYRVNRNDKLVIKADYYDGCGVVEVQQPIINVGLLETEQLDTALISAIFGGVLFVWSVSVGVGLIINMIRRARI